MVARKVVLAECGIEPYLVSVDRYVSRMKMDAVYLIASDATVEPFATVAAFPVRESPRRVFDLVHRGRCSHVRVVEAGERRGVLKKVSVKTSVAVDQGGSLDISDSTVGTSIQATGARWLKITNNKITIAVQLSRTTGKPPSGRNLVCGNTIGTSLQLTSNHADFQIGTGSGGGLSPACKGNMVHLSLQVTNNKGAISIAGNTVGLSIQCLGNTPKPTVGENKAKTIQC